MTADALADPPLERTWTPAGPLDLLATLRPLRRGTGDPSFQVDGSRVWRTARTPLGPVTLAVGRRAGAVEALAWGPGAPWALNGLPDLLGARDDWSTLDLSVSTRLADALHRNPGLRLCRTNLVFDALLPAVLEQKVTGIEARRAWRYLLYRHGEPAPGPTPRPMRIIPTPQTVLRVPTWDWHRAGVDHKRVAAIRAAATVAARLEQCVDMSTADAHRRLRHVPGVGVWTVAETVQRALGDPDAISVGDFHIPNLVVHVLTGRARGSDEEMIEVLAPWAGQRQRVVRVIESLGTLKECFGQ